MDQRGIKILFGESMFIIKPTYKSKSESQKSSIKILFDGRSGVLIKQYVNINTTCLSNPIS